jgi:hypothetical protein
MKKQVKIITLVAASAACLAVLGSVLGEKPFGELLAGGTGPSYDQSIRKLTFTADDFASGSGTVTKNGNTFTYNPSYLTVSGGRINVVRGGVFFTNTVDEITAQDDTVAHGFAYIGMSFNGLTVDFTGTTTTTASTTTANFCLGTANTTHAESRKTKTWADMMWNRGTGAGAGTTDTVFTNVDHQWENRTNTYVDFWINTVKLDLETQNVDFSLSSFSVSYLCAPAGVGHTAPSLNTNMTDGGTYSMGLSETKQFTAAFNYADSSASYVWASSDTSVFTVNNGLVSPLKAGSATLTLTAKYGTDTYAYVQQTRTMTINVRAQESVAEAGTKGQADYKITNMENLTQNPIQLAGAIDYQNVYDSTSTNSLKLTFTGNSWPAMGLSLPSGFVNDGGTLTFYMKFVNANVHCNVTLATDAYVSGDAGATIGTADANGWYPVSFDCSSMIAKTANPTYVSLYLNFNSTTDESGNVSTIYVDKMTYHGKEKTVVTGTPGASGYSVTNIENCVLTYNPGFVTASLDTEHVHDSASEHSIKMAHPTSGTDYPYIDFTLPTGFKVGGGTLSFDIMASGTAGTPIEVRLCTDVYSGWLKAQGSNYSGVDTWTHITVDYSTLAVGTDYIDAPTRIDFTTHVPEGGIVYIDNINFAIA